MMFTSGGNVTHDFSAQKTELLAILLAATDAERRGDTEAAKVLNEMLVIQAAHLETEIVLAQDEVSSTNLN